MNEFHVEIFLGADWRDVTVDPIHPTLVKAIARITSTGRAPDWVRITSDGRVRVWFRDGVMQGSAEA